MGVNTGSSNDIFIWKSYGDIRVYSIVDPINSEILKSVLLETLEWEGEILPKDVSWKEIEQAIERQMYSDSEAFEVGTRFSELI